MIESIARFAEVFQLRNLFLKHSLLICTCLVIFGSHIKDLHAWQDEATESVADDAPRQKSPVDNEKSVAPSDVDIDDESSDSKHEVIGVSFSNPVKNRWRVGVQIKAGASSVQDLFVTIPVPNEWPEQSVKTYLEELPASIPEVVYRDLDQNLKQLVVKMRRIPANELVELKVTYEIETRQINVPPDTTVFKVPSKRAVREVKTHLGSSPQISFRSSKFRKLVKELTANKPDAWSEVKTLYDWIRDNVEYRQMDPTDSLNTFRKKQGCAEDLVGLFIAMCRCHKVPARTVWVEGHQYAEFYLVDENKNGHWFPVQMAGLTEFGKISEPRIILQKGDNLQVPEKKERQKYVAEFVVASGKIKPRVNFVRDLLPANLP